MSAIPGEIEINFTDAKNYENISIKSREFDVGNAESIQLDKENQSPHTINENNEMNPSINKLDEDDILKKLTPGQVYHFKKMEDVIMQKQSSSEENTTSSLCDLMNTFHTLKKRYIDQQIKQNFLERIADPENPVDKIQDRANQLSELCEKTAETKKALQETKDKCEQLKEEIREIATIGPKLEAEITDLYKRNADLLQEIEKKKLEWTKLQDNSACLRKRLESSIGKKLASDEDCANVLEKQTESIQKLNTRQHELEEVLLDRKSHHEAAKEINNIAVEQAANAGKDMKAHQYKQEMSKMKNISNWYQSMIKTLELISGMKIVSVDSNLLKIIVYDSHIIQFSLDAASASVNDVKIEPSDIEIDDLLFIVTQEKNIGYFVREFRNRVENQQKWVNDVKELSKLYPVSFDPEKRLFQFTYPVGVVVQLQMSYEYSNSRLIIETMEGIGGWKKNELASIMCEVNKSCPFTILIPFSQYLKERLSQVEGMENHS